MANYIIAYELRDPSRDVAPLTNAITALGIHWHGPKDVWVVKSSISVAQLRDILKLHLFEGDNLLVATLSSGKAWAGFSKGDADWLNRYL